ncbi:MAG: aminotransferase class V-fold PLP-dependent enzyme [Opitutae bacterium]|nr:aminotransferase class V-fold PLP-dependent enzyme [Opitutae bacterium]
MPRKTFLRQIGWGTLGVALAGDRLAAAMTSEAKLPVFEPSRSDQFWRAVRGQYELAADLTYLNTGGLGPSPRVVGEAFASTTRSLQGRLDTGHALFDEARRVVADFFGAAPDEVCFTRNTTEGNSIVAAGLDLRAGDEVILESHAHPGGSLPWLNQAKRRGIAVKVFEPDPSSPTGNLERIRALIRSRTRAVQVSHVTAPTGILMPVREIAALAREQSIWFHVDGAQSSGMVPFSLREIGCDSFATSGHKWLGGPRETGVLFIRRERNDEVSPAHVGAYSSCDFDFDGRLTYADGARRHEYGTRNAASVVALAAAIRFQQEVGRTRVADCGASLAQRVQAGLAPIRGVEILTPASPQMRAAMTTFAVPGVEAARLFGYLMEHHALRCRPVTETGLQAVRVSTHVFNTPAECDRLIAAVRDFVRAT